MVMSWEQILREVFSEILSRELQALIIFQGTREQTHLRAAVGPIGSKEVWVMTSFVAALMVWTLGATQEKMWPYSMAIRVTLKLSSMMLRANRLLPIKMMAISKLKTRAPMRGLA